jgi:glycosyltransferase involved in cell wall biosynthesis
MEAPVVSVIIPTYNRESYIIEAIESVLNQTFDDLEIIIIDDGSTDNTPSIVKRIHDSRIRYFYLKHNNGVAAALNYGIKNSKGKYISRLDSDDIFLPEKIGSQVEVLENNPDIGLVYTRAYNISEQGDIVALYPAISTHPENPLKMLRHFLFTPSQSIVFRKQCIERIGLYDTTIRFSSDWDFCVRMAARYKFFYIPIPLVKIRKHNNMLTGDKLRSVQHTVMVLEKHKQLLAQDEGFQWLSPWYYHVGRQLFYRSDYLSARNAFRTAVRFQVVNFKALVFWALTMLPAELLQIMKRSYWKKSA